MSHNVPPYPCNHSLTLTPGGYDYTGIAHVEGILGAAEALCPDSVFLANIRQFWTQNGFITLLHCDCIHDILDVWGDNDEEDCGDWVEWREVDLDDRK